MCNGSNKNPFVPGYLPKANWFLFALFKLNVSKCGITVQIKKKWIWTKCKKCISYLCIKCFHHCISRLYIQFNFKTYGLLMCSFYRFHLGKLIQVSGIFLWVQEENNYQWVLGTESDEAHLTVSQANNTENLSLIPVLTEPNYPNTTIKQCSGKAPSELLRGEKDIKDVYELSWKVDRHLLITRLALLGSLGTAKHKSFRMNFKEPFINKNAYTNYIPFIT